MRDGSFPFGNGTGKPTLVRGHLPLKFQWITHTKRLTNDRAAYSAERVEEEFSEVRIAPVLCGRS
jgi:hypothetical protein